MKEIITGIEYDKKTNLPVLTDIRGNLHVTSWESINKDDSSQRYYLQTWVKGYTWAKTNDFNRIPNAMNPGTFLEMIVPGDKCFNISFIMLSQARNNDMGLSIVGFYVNGTLKVAIPFSRDVHYVLFSPLALPSGTHVELKYMPFHKNCEVGIVLGGPLVSCV